MKIIESDVAEKESFDLRSLPLGIRNVELQLTSTKDQLYVLNKPKILTFVITRDPESAESKIMGRIGKRENNFLGSVFGRFDLLFEIESESAEAGFEVLNSIRRDFLETPKSQAFAGSLLSLLCYPVRLTARGWRTRKNDFRYGAYCVFRVVPKGTHSGVLDDATTEVLEAFESIKMRYANIKVEILWNPSLVSYVLCLKGDSFDSLSESLAYMRRKALPIRDYCTFVVVSESHTKKRVRQSRVSASVNVKLGDSRLLPQMLKLSSAEYRLGYFDVTRDITANSPEALLSQIAEMRKPFEASSPPNWTATVLKFDSSKILGEEA